MSINTTSDGQQLIIVSIQRLAAKSTALANVTLIHSTNNLQSVSHPGCAYSRLCFTTNAPGPQPSPKTAAPDTTWNSETAHSPSGGWGDGTVEDSAGAAQH